MGRLEEGREVGVRTPSGPRNPQAGLPSNPHLEGGYSQLLTSYIETRNRPKIVAIQSRGIGDRISIGFCEVGFVTFCLVFAAV